MNSLSEFKYLSFMCEILGILDDIFLSRLLIAHIKKQNWSAFNPYKYPSGEYIMVGTMP